LRAPGVTVDQSSEEADDVARACAFVQPSVANSGSIDDSLALP
jgi:hypothetical protein